MPKTFLVCALERRLNERGWRGHQPQPEVRLGPLPVRVPNLLSYVHPSFLLAHDMQ